MLFEKKYEEKHLCLRVHFNRRMDRQPFDILHIGVHDFMCNLLHQSRSGGGGGGGLRREEEEEEEEEEWKRRRESSRKLKFLTAYP